MQFSLIDPHPPTPPSSNPGSAPALGSMSTYLRLTKARFKWFDNDPAYHRYTCIPVIPAYHRYTCDIGIPVIIRVIVCSHDWFAKSPLIADANIILWARDNIHANTIINHNYHRCYIILQWSSSVCHSASNDAESVYMQFVISHLHDLSSIV